MQTPKGHKVDIANLGMTGFLFRCLDKEVIVSSEGTGYLLWKGESKKQAKSFESFDEAKQAALVLLDKLLIPPKSKKKAAEKKEVKKDKPKKVKPKKKSLKKSSK